MNNLDRSREVVGKIHEPSAVKYWIEKIKPPPVVVCWLKNYVPLFSRDVWSLIQSEILRPYELTWDQKMWLEKKVLWLEKLGAITKVGTARSCPAALLEVSPIFLVSKLGPKRYRLVIDLRRLNKRLPEKLFRFEGLGGLLRSVGKGWSMITLDLRDGYHHVLMDEEAWHFLGFHVENDWYQYRVLPFGLSQAVWVFSKIMQALVAHWRQMGIASGSHVDDIWIAHPQK